MDNASVNGQATGELSHAAEDMRAGDDNRTGNAEASPLLQAPGSTGGLTSKQKSLNVAVVAVALFCDFLLMTIIIPIIPFEKERLKYSPFSNVESSISAVFAAKPVMQVLGNPLSAHLVMKAGPRGTLLVGLVILAGSTAGMAFGSTFYFLVGGRMLQGLASSSTMTAGMTWLASCHPAEERGAAMGTAMAGVALGVLLGPTVGGLLYHVGGWSAPFFAVAGLLVLNCAAQVLLGTASPSGPEDDDANGPSALSSMARLLCDPYVAVLALAIFLANGSIGMLEVLTPNFLRDTYDMSPPVVALSWSASTLAYVVFTPPSGMLSDKMTTWPLVAFGLVVMVVGLLGLSFAMEVHLSVASLAVVGMSMAFVDTPSQPLLADIVDARGLAAYGAVFAISDIMASLGFVVGPIVAGAVAPLAGFPFVLRLMAGASGFGLLLFVLFVVRPLPRKKEKNINP